MAFVTLCVCSRERETRKGVLEKKVEERTAPTRMRWNSDWRSGERSALGTRRLSSRRCTRRDKERAVRSGESAAETGYVVSVILAVLLQYVAVVRVSWEERSRRGRENERETVGHHAGLTESNDDEVCFYRIGLDPYHLIMMTQLDTLRT